MSLSDKQAAFVREYLVDANGAAAARRAGYSENAARVTASKLLAKPAIKAALAAGQAELAEATGISAQTVVRDLYETYREAREAGDFGPAVSALDKLAKHTGAYETDNAQKRNDPYAGLTLDEKRTLVAGARHVQRMRAASNRSTPDPVEN